ncbi:MAG TPA: carboxymuconolactone decarboxylase family protein [Gemmatimonadota bacterium]|nr:carboxymuconolactone decarboxylase family protein [Gemmatimonadota bacterium]
MAYIEHPDDPGRPAIFRISPREFRRAHVALHLEILGGEGPLSRVQREMIALVVSRINGCRY